MAVRISLGDLPSSASLRMIGYFPILVGSTTPGGAAEAAMMCGVQYGVERCWPAASECRLQRRLCNLVQGETTDGSEEERQERRQRQRQRHGGLLSEGRTRALHCLEGGLALVKRSRQ